MNATTTDRHSARARVREAARLSARAEAAARLEPEVARLAAANGLTVKFTRPVCHGVATCHWIFARGGRQILQAWPASGRWWGPLTGERGKVAGDLLALVEVAVEAAG